MSEVHEIQAPELPKELVDALDKLTDEKKWRSIQYTARETRAYLDAVREKVKGYPGFWPYTLFRHEILKNLASIRDDQDALSYLADVELKQDEVDPRPFELVFHFSENPYFSNSILSKKYTLRDEYKSEENKSEFEPEHLHTAATKVDWKSPERDLSAKYPRKRTEAADISDGDFEGDVGSFFLFFTEEGDPLQIGLIFVEDVLPVAADYFAGRMSEQGSEDEEEDDDELDEESGDDEEDIDLEEEPVKKRRKV